MKKIILAALCCIALSSTALSQAQVTFDSLLASSQYFTVRIDSTFIRGTNTKRADSTFYADPRTRPGASLIQMQITVLSSLGYKDTIVVKKLMKGAYNMATDTYDSVWVTVPIMNMATALVDTIGLVNLGPYSANGGGQYCANSFLVYDAFFGGTPWRISRQSGKGHPTKPDASKTHKLLFTFERRK